MAPADGERPPGAPCPFPPCQGISPEGDADPGGGLDLEEFSRYLQEREQRLLLLFHSLDRNQDGKAQGEAAGALETPMGLELAALGGGGRATSPG